MSKSKRIEKPFKNKFDQLIHPGAEVIIITVCTGQTKIRFGTYLGVLEKEGSKYNYTLQQREPYTYQRVQVSSLFEENRYVYEGTDTPVDWTVYRKYRETHGKHMPVTQIKEFKPRITTLNDNNILLGHSTTKDLISAV